MGPEGMSGGVTRSGLSRIVGGGGAGRQDAGRGQGYEPRCQCLRLQSRAPRPVKVVRRAVEILTALGTFALKLYVSRGRGRWRRTTGRRSSEGCSPSWARRSLKLGRVCPPAPTSALLNTLKSSLNCRMHFLLFLMKRPFRALRKNWGSRKQRQGFYNKRSFATCLKLLLGPDGEELRNLAVKEAVRVTEAVVLGTAIDSVNSILEPLRVLAFNKNANSILVMNSSEQESMLELWDRVYRIWKLLRSSENFDPSILLPILQYGKTEDHFLHRPFKNLLVAILEGVLLEGSLSTWLLAYCNRFFDRQIQFQHVMNNLSLNAESCESNVVP